MITSFAVHLKPLRPAQRDAIQVFPTNPDSRCGAKEKTNRLLRQCLPKGTDLGCLPNGIISHPLQLELETALFIVLSGSYPAFVKRSDGT
ncbi:MAG: hypothetical protein ABI856_08995 [Nitrospira sp.]